MNMTNDNMKKLWPNFIKHFECVKSSKNWKGMRTSPTKLWPKQNNSDFFQIWLGTPSLLLSFYSAFPTMSHSLICWNCQRLLSYNFHKKRKQLKWHTENIRNLVFFFIKIIASWSWNSFMRVYSFEPISEHLFKRWCKRTRLSYITLERIILMRLKDHP